MPCLVMSNSQVKGSIYFLQKVHQKVLQSASNLLPMNNVLAILNNSGSGYPYVISLKVHYSFAWYSIEQIDFGNNWKSELQLLLQQGVEFVL